MSRLITPSLVGAVDWCKACPESWKERAYKALTAQLGRESFGPRPAPTLGKNFEDAVYAHVDEEGKGSLHFQWFVTECKGGVFQKKLKKIVELDGEEYCLYGRADVWFPDVIKDIKTTSNYNGRTHYLRSFQHKMYCFVERIYRFRYLVAEFDAAQKIVAHYGIDYAAEDHAKLEEEVFAGVRDVVRFLSVEPELMRLYTTKFSIH